jgi:RNA recognition motif-containing protein
MNNFLPQSPDPNNQNIDSANKFNYRDQLVYSAVPIQQSTSFNINDHQNFHHFNQQMDTQNNGSHYNLLNNHQTLNSPQFNSSIPANSIPLLSQNSDNSSLLQPIIPNNLIPSSVVMTPQLSVNSQLGSNDLINSPDLNNNYINIGNNNNNNNNINNNQLLELSNIPSRTVYLGNIPNDITPNELLNHVRSGTVESLKLIPSKNCAFISFLDDKSATLFHSDAILKRLTINNHDIKIGWGKPSPVQPVVASCVSRYNATRNVYVGNLLDNVTENELRNDFQEYGEIDTIKILKDKKVAFVHFTSILAAIRCVQSLPLVEKYKDRRIFYGKDRCAFITKTQQHNAAQYLGLNPNTDNFLNQVDRDLIANALVQQSNAAAMIATSTGGTSNLGNRTIYLGNLHPDSTIEEICNVVRGGILQNVRLINERHVCFITFIDPISAAQFYAMSSLHGLIIHNRKIKVGWGKHSGPLPNSINLAVGNGASRNIYIGGLDKIPEIQFNKDKLYNDFKEFGEIEQINFFQERHCCFVNFTNISNAIKAIDGIRSNPDYGKCKINFGKDRCGNTPRQFQLQNHNNHNNIIYNNENNNNNNNSNFENYNFAQNENGYVHDSNTNSNYLSNSDVETKNDKFINTYNNNNNNNTNNNREDEDDEEDDEDDYIDEAKIRFQPLGIILDNNQLNLQ